MKYRKKPLVIEAMQFDGTNFDALYEWGNPGGKDITAQILPEGSGADSTRLTIATPAGNMRATVGDWIIKGIEGEFYPCCDDIFKLTYEEEKE